jgi:tetratricopeptide (TPR) repeat protein
LPRARRFAQFERIKGARPPGFAKQEKLTIVQSKDAFDRRGRLALITATFVLSAAQSGCSILSGGAADVPVEDRSVRAGSGKAPVSYAPQTTPDTPANRQVLVSPLDRPEAGGWQPIEDTAPEDAPRDYTEAAPGDLNPAVIALLNRANASERAGELDQSAASLERALRIQPDNAWLWHRLALLRLFQHQNEDAVSMAAKSNALAGGNARLQADNWRVIAQARERLGQAAAARSASEKARALED